MTELSAAEVAAIRERANKATPGPWAKVTSRDVLPAVIAPGRAAIAMDFDSDADADFVAASRSDVHRLCDTIDAMRAKIERLKAEREKITAFMDGVRDTARNRNPEGATILDFMACWNEQYKARIAELEAEACELRGSCNRSGCIVQEAIANH